MIIFETDEDGKRSVAVGYYRLESLMTVAPGEASMEERKGGREGRDPS